MIKIEWKTKQGKIDITPNNLSFLAGRTPLGEAAVADLSDQHPVDEMNPESGPRAGWDWFTRKVARELGLNPDLLTLAEQWDLMSSLSVQGLIGRMENTSAELLNGAYVYLPNEDEKYPIKS